MPLDLDFYIFKKKEDRISVPKKMITWKSAAHEQMSQAFHEKVLNKITLLHIEFFEVKGTYIFLMKFNFPCLGAGGGVIMLNLCSSL